MNRDIDEWLRHHDTHISDVVDISGGWTRSHNWALYEELHYPAFDLCDNKSVPRHYDLVLCEQVLEHVVDPVAAGRKLLELLHPEGWLVVNTPFLIRVHPAPGDYWRFTEDGLRLLLEHVGFVNVTTHSWGNRRCVAGNFRNWRRYFPWHSLKNDPLLPVVVWAYAQRPGS